MSETLDASPRIRRIEEITPVLDTCRSLKDSMAPSSSPRILTRSSSEAETVGLGFSCLDEAEGSEIVPEDPFIPEESV